MTTTTWQSTPAGKAFLLRHGKKKKVRITWLARARILSGQSVAQAAKACGLNARTWAAWERDAKKPCADAIFCILAHFDDALRLGMLVTQREVTVSTATLEVLGE
jgi:transcriptional regulator with XRE-family HTH domain